MRLDVEPIENRLEATRVEKWIALDLAGELVEDIAGGVRVAVARQHPLPQQIGLNQLRARRVSTSFALVVMLIEIDRQTANVKTRRPRLGIREGNQVELIIVALSLTSL
jgi:hypothetical protein